jgi:hypothetical protein
MNSINRPFNIPEPSMVANKSRVYPKWFGNLPPQNINDSLKPVNKRFKYYVKPLASYETVEYLASEVDRSILKDINNNIILKGQTIIENGEEVTANYNYIPPELYTYNWHTLNKQFILNHGRNIGSFPTNKNPFIDRAVFLELKRLYPTANDEMLRANYAQLVAKHRLATRENADSFSPMERLKLTNSVITRLAILLEPATTKDQFWEIINITVQNVPFAYISSKFRSVNKSILQRNEYLFKLAFVCGSTDDTVITDIADMKTYMEYSLGTL